MAPIPLCGGYTFMASGQLLAVIFLCKQSRTAARQKQPIKRTDIKYLIVIQIQLLLNRFLMQISGTHQRKRKPNIFDNMIRKTIYINSLK